MKTEYRLIIHEEARSWGMVQWQEKFYYLQTRILSPKADVIGTWRTVPVVQFSSLSPDEIEEMKAVLNP